MSAGESSRKKISIVGGCYNEAENLREFYERCRNVLAKHPEYDYEFVLADNCSTDESRRVLRELAAEDSNFRVIFNSANFGHIRSPYNAFLAAKGHGVVSLCTDLQEPPEVIDEFIRRWEEGYKVVVGVRSGTRAGVVMETLRRLYYWLLAKSAANSGGGVISRFTGFGLYDRQFVEALRKYNEPYPYFRGLVGEIGFRRAEVPFVQEKRRHGESKNNWFTLYDMAMTGFVNQTRMPLRMAAFCGFATAGVSFMVAVVYLIYKLLNWDNFYLGMAPLVTGMFFMAGVQLIFLGVIGEYLGAVWTQVRNRPLVVEEERINFNPPEDKQKC